MIATNHSILRLASFVLFPAFLVLSSPGYAQVTCIKDQMGFRPIGTSTTEAEELISQIVRGVGLTPDGIIVLPCDGITKVQSYYPLQDDIPKRDYILFDPIWTREVMGFGNDKGVDVKARDQALFIFGHELGHILGRHFTTNSQLSRLNKETDADHFAGCFSWRNECQMGEY